MKAILVWATFFPAITFAQEWNISINEGVFGVPWTSSETEIVEILGEPNGYFQMSRFRKLIYYGKSHSLVLINDQLKGYHFLEHNHSNLLNESVAINQEFDRSTITLDGKDIIEKSFADVESLMGIDLGNPDYRSTFATDFVTVKFTFSSTSFGNEQSYRLMGIQIDYEL